MSTPDDLRLLGLAEQLGAPEVSLGDPRDEALLSRLLDQCTDALVDVVQGRQSLSRPAPAQPEAPPGMEGQRPCTDGGTQIDGASCSALAVLCHRAARLLASRPDQSVAAPLADCLRTVADSLQRVVQDLPEQQAPATRQRLRRGLRRAGAQLDRAAPKVAP